MDNDNMNIMQHVREALANQSKTILCAYKKLKSSVYFDKTRIHVAERVVNFETKIREEISEDTDEPTDFMRALEQALTPIMDDLVRADSTEWDLRIADIVDSVKDLSFPKNTVSCFEEAQQDDFRGGTKVSSGRGTIIHILDPDKPIPVIKRIQSVIDMDIRGFLLGILWVMLVGIGVDQKFGEWVYGNRLKSTIRNHPSSMLTFSPYLFQPYFSQYESWRNKALHVAESIADNGDEAILFMTDLKSFYYSVDFREKDLEKLTESTCGLSETMRERAFPVEDRVITRLNDFILRVVRRYSKEYNGSQDGVDGKNLLPIGFDPSCILSNWCLQEFDQEIINKIGPAFYGRYVDDIIIVERAPKGSVLSARLNSDSFTVDESIRVIFGLSDESRFCKGKGAITGCSQYDLLVSPSPSNADRAIGADDESNTRYEINREFLNCPESEIELQVAKTSLIAISPDAQRPLLEHFKSTIAKNSSAFNLMPNIGDMSIDSVFEDIFEMDSAASPNKLRDLRELKLNPFELSKFLGQCQRVLPLVGDSRIKEFTEQILMLFSYQDLISFYTTWEKLFEIMLYSRQIDCAAQLYCNIRRSIEKLQVKRDRLYSSPNRPEETIQSEIQFALENYLSRILTKVVALCDERAIKRFISLVDEKSSEEGSIRSLSAGTKLESPLSWLKDARAYFESNMVDKYAMPVPPVMMSAILDLAMVHDAFRETSFTDLSDIMYMMRFFVPHVYSSAGDADVAKQLEARIKKILSPLPYMVKIQDLQFFLNCFCIACGRDEFGLAESSGVLYACANYYSPDGGLDAERIEDHFPFDCLTCISTSGIPDDSEPPVDAIRHNVIGVDRKRKFDSGAINVAVANVCLSDKVLDEAIKGYKPKFEDYRALQRLTAESKREGANLIVLPELSVPFEWVPRLMTFSANEGIAVVCGIRYVLGGPSGDKVYNFTASMLPFTLETPTSTYRYSHLRLHNKVFFPPKEVSMILNYQKTPVIGRSFDLFVWKDFWFPVYCCFELASPFERVAFSSLADALIAVEWNPDVGFYDNIISALARDMSCYCIQANNSVYGDSRIEQPKETKYRTMLRVSGGTNWSIIVGGLSIEEIRNCQIKDDGGKSFKPPAPDYNHEHAKLRMDGMLWDHLKREHSAKGDKASR